MLQDFLFRGDLADLDPDLADLINLEAARQRHRLIMIPSESTVPYAVRQALTSHYHNLYTEGYPPEEMRTMPEAALLDFDMHLAHFRRYSDPRYYKGTEFANLVEALARRRCAELFATDQLSADQLHVNVQPLSGAPANSAVYTALLTPGDTIMGMDLLHGGHLTHGSPAARSGKQYNAIFYGVHPETELIDYEAAYATAIQHRPKIVIGGYSSYPMAPDWRKLREIADACGALLMADIAHVAGLVAAGVYPSPVGIADIVTFTTHKTLGGPRGAVIITHRADLAKKLDRGVFPGEQGGPHMNSIAALAVALKLARTEQFKALQAQTVKNAIRLAEKLREHGLRLVYGGTNTHLLVVDVSTVRGADGTPLSGDMAARILDLVGITCNRNTIPGDTSAARPSGIRLGTPWITQRGFREPEIDRLASIIAHTLKATQPFSYAGKGGKDDPRAKLPFEALIDARHAVAALCDEAGIDYVLPVVGARMTEKGKQHVSLWVDEMAEQGALSLIVRGAAAADFLRVALTSKVYGLAIGDSEPTSLLDKDGVLIASGILERVEAETYHLHLSAAGGRAAAWLQALSDGFVSCDPLDIYGKVPGPVVVSVLGKPRKPLDVPIGTLAGFYAEKDYFVGARGACLPVERGKPLPLFTWSEPPDQLLKRTPLYDIHKRLGAKMAPFGGYEMPLWYKSVSAEHAAVRTAAGVFDVSHMGVWDVRGPSALHFLDRLTTNDVRALQVGEAHYSYLLGVDGVPLDDIYVYRLDQDHFMLVVNASNNDKDWAWVNAVRRGEVQIDSTRPSARLLDNPDDVALRDLRDLHHGEVCRVDIALQGQASLGILQGMAHSEADKKRLANMAWSTVGRFRLGEFDLIISRTGYTGERIAFELFVHPEQAAALFEALIAAGAHPCGLASRDSTRIEAGLPLYGHELGGMHAFTPGDAGFGSYVKLWKPFFVGKLAYLERERKRDATIVRFRMQHKGVRPPQSGAAVLDRRGNVIGVVTSCSIDSEGYQCGQAYVKEAFSAPETPLLILNVGKEAVLPASVALGDRLPVPDAATVLTRFPAKKK
ncbi:MAG: glycine cleavage system aminomethyltransferase GcvT [Aggregatilineales bacterium]